MPQDCKPISNTEMTCHAPPVPSFKGNDSEVFAGFILDGVNLQSNFTKLTMIPNPEFAKFGGVHVLQGENLILEVLFE